MNNFKINTNKKIAIVHDDFMQWGGAERLILKLAEALPEAPIFTSMLKPEVIVKSGINLGRFRSTWMDGVPFKEKLNKLLFPLYSIAFEHINFDEFDIVISSSTRFAHGIVTKPDVTHIAYINSPFRGFWEPRLYFGSSKKGKIVHALLEPTLSRLRRWDYVAGQRADMMLANSSTAQARVKKYYRRDSQILYPFVDFKRFDEAVKPLFELPEKYYVIVGRMVDWKRFDIAVKAFNESGKNLLVIGTGPDVPRLKHMAKDNVKVLGFVGDAEVSHILRNAQALIHPQKEDFGMTVVEANYCGIPAIAYVEGGAQDSIIENETGMFFRQQTAESLNAVVQSFEQRGKESFNASRLKDHATKFGIDTFYENWRNILQHVD